MDYDPVKDRLGAVAWRSPARTKAFYRLLDLVFLRAWYVRRRLRRLLGPLADRPVRVLDAGTGFGQYAYFLVSEFPNVEVTAVDVKEDYLRRARAFFDRTPHGGRVRFQQRDLTATPPEDETGRYDLVLSVDVMEHIEDDRAVFRGFHEVLRPGGYVVVNTPSDLGGSGVTDATEASFIGEHVRNGYAYGDLREKLETAGLRVVGHEYTYGPAGSAAWRLLVKWPLTLLNRSWALAPLVALYYVPALPLGLGLNAADLRRRNRAGTGHLMVARKPVAAHSEG
ncbi:MAG: class I SAM-dependent methyltransferase [Rubricoccaceae bacterium]|nr:class I SAM-dependent methyltransferase [Rubricoccaceae bacterium]